MAGSASRPAERGPLQRQLVGARLGNVPVRKLRADQVAMMVSELAKSGSASRARNADGIGMVLGPPKTNRTAGRQLLAPTALALLKAHRERWLEMRDRSAVEWPETTYQGKTLALVFVNPSGKPMLRQHVDKAIRKAAQEIIGIDPSEIGTHTGRRSVVTNLYASGDLDLENVARFVGHSDVSARASASRYSSAR
jgi:site-specific recombinase XerD